MSNFTPLVEKTYEFEGDTVKVRFSRLKRKHTMELIPDMFSENSVDQSEVIRKALNFGDVIADEYIHEMSGLKDTEGNSIEAKTVFEEIYFIRLANSILLDLINESFVEAKNM